MAEICLKHNVKLLTYGTLCGGFISSRYLGVPDPLHSPHLTPSQRKYAQMINLWGGWELFQSLLSTLHRIAERKGPEFDISNIATRYILEKPYVGGVIIGARLGISEHIEQNLKVFEFELDGRDYSEIDEVLKRSNGERMFQVIGDCGDEYRG